LSPAIRDILKMVDAKVDQTVILTYIKNSPIPYSLTATEIIALKQRGVPDELTAAVVEHGGQVRAQLAQAAAQNPGTGPQYSTAPATPPYSYGSAYGAAASPLMQIIHLATTRRLPLTKLPLLLWVRHNY
jgi:hypothetical protein